MTVKKVPDLIFKYDNSYEHGKKIEEILGKINYTTEEGEDLGDNYNEK